MALLNGTHSQTIFQKLSILFIPLRKVGHMIDNTDFSVPKISDTELQKHYLNWYNNLALRNLAYVKQNKVGEVYAVNGAYDHWHIATKMQTYPQMVTLLNETDLPKMFDYGLDIGCGTVTFFDFISVRKSILVDIVPVYCAFMKEKGYNAVEGNIESLQFEDCVFDTIVCSDILEHVLSLEKSLSELSRVAKQGCLLFVNVPWNQKVSGNILNFSHIRTFTTTSLSIFEKYGFVLKKKRLVDTEDKPFLATMNLIFVKE